MPQWVKGVMTVCEQLELDGNRGNQRYLSELVSQATRWVCRANQTRFVDATSSTLSLSTLY